MINPMWCDDKRLSSRNCEVVSCVKGLQVLALSPALAAGGCKTYQLQQQVDKAMQQDVQDVNEHWWCLEGLAGRGLGLTFGSAEGGSCA
jgi:hypothetical protein